MERVSRLALGLLLALSFPQTARAAPPSASFSVSPPLPLTFETVTFTSTSSGDVSSAAWDLDGDGFYDDGTGPSAARSFSTPSLYYVSLRVVGPGGSGEQTQTVRVLNRAPAASIAYFPAGPEAGEPVTFVSTSSDPDGTLTSQAWDLDGDGAFDDGSGSMVSHSFATAGTFLVQLRVADGDGGAAEAAQLVRVAPKAPEFLRPFPVVRVEGRVTASGARVRRLVVEAPPGARVEVRCRGRGCKRHRRVRIVRARSGPNALAPRRLRFRRFERRLRAGAVLEIFVTKPGTIGKYTRFTIREGEQPRRRDLCLPPGSKRPTRCRG